MQPLLVLANILFMIAGAASFTNFYFDCMGDGMILDKWGRYVQREVRHNAKVEAGELYDKFRVPFWKKMIGACIICTNFWLTVFLFSLWILGSWFHVLAIGLAIIGLSNTAIRIIAK